MGKLSLFSQVSLAISQLYAPFSWGIICIFLFNFLFILSRLLAVKWFWSKLKLAQLKYQIKTNFFILFKLFKLHHTFLFGAALLAMSLNLWYIRNILILDIIHREAYKFQILSFPNQLAFYKILLIYIPKTP